MKYHERISVITVYVTCYCDRCNRQVGAIANCETKIGGGVTDVSGIQFTGACSVCGRKAGRLMIDYKHKVERVK